MVARGVGRPSASEWSRGKRQRASFPHSDSLPDFSDDRGGHVDMLNSLVRIPLQRVRDLGNTNGQNRDKNILKTLGCVAPSGSIDIQLCVLFAALADTGDSKAR